MPSMLIHKHALLPLSIHLFLLPPLYEYCLQANQKSEK